MADQATIPIHGENATPVKVPHLSFERVGWVRCLWSGFRFHFNAEMDDCGPTAWYADGAVVVGFWVYRFRIWTIAKPARPRG